MLATDPPADEGFSEAQQEVMATSDRSVIRSVRYGHSELLEEPRALGVLVDLIHTVAAEGHPQTAVVSSGSP
jgi:hypothetical protein